MPEKKPSGINHNITHEMHRAASGLQPSDACKAAIDEKISTLASQPAKKGENIMKKRNLAKAAAIAAAFVALSGTTVFAITNHRASMYGYSSSNYEYTDYEDLSKVEKKAGIQANVPERFTNGYTFEGAVIETFGELTETGEKASKYKGLSLTYTKGDSELNVMVEPDIGTDGDHSTATETREIAPGIAAYYSRDTYLFVPDRSAVTEEDLKREESDPHFFISEGSDEPETNIYTGVSFTVGTTRYHIFSNDTEFSADEMFDMALEIVEK